MQYPASEVYRLCFKEKVTHFRWHWNTHVYSWALLAGKIIQFIEFQEFPNGCESNYHMHVCTVDVQYMSNNPERLLRVLQKIHNNRVGQRGVNWVTFHPPPPFFCSHVFSKSNLNYESNIRISLKDLDCFNIWNLLALKIKVYPPCQISGSAPEQLFWICIHMYLILILSRQ